MNTLKPVLIFIIGILSFSQISVSQESDSLYYLNPERFTAELLFKKKIVMLADFEHQAPAPYHSLSLTLNYWLDMCNSAD